MFNELLELGKRLEQEGKLPSPGFYHYKEPIKWVIHFDPDKPERSSIRQTEINNLPRPYSVRTRGTEPYPMADEAAYVLGIDRGSGKGKDTATKHLNFIAFLKKIETESNDQEISRVAEGIRNLLEKKELEKLPEWKNIESKDWVSIQIEGRAGNGKQLIEHPVIQNIWIDELTKRCLPDRGEGKSKLSGECGISGEKVSMLAGRIPLAVTLYKPSPLHSLNADAFVSGIEGKNISDVCHIGQSIEAGDQIARTLNYLSKHPLHHKIIAKAIEAGKLKNDSPSNLFAFYWIEKQDETRSLTDVSPDEILAKASLLFGKENDRENDSIDENEQPLNSKDKNNSKLPVDLSQLEALLNTPWTGQKTSLQLDEKSFCLLMLSPNKGRISVREWFKVGLGRLRTNLKEFLDAQRIEAPDGSTERCFAIQDMLLALEESNISQPEYKPSKELASPNMTRALLRCAYLGEAPPTGLLEPAVICFRHPKVLKRYEQKNDRKRFALLQHQLAAVMKLILTHPKSEIRMNEDYKIPFEGKSPAFLSGCLLAVLEEAQLAAMNWRINTTLIDQFYSTAATAPCSVLGMLVSRITSQHMPKLRKNMRGKYDKLEQSLEVILTTLDQQGGFPKTLSLKQQAEFSLGFYSQRAAFSNERPFKNNQKLINQPTAEQGAPL